MKFFVRLATHTAIHFFDLIHTGTRKEEVQCDNGTPQENK